MLTNKTKYGLRFPVLIKIGTTTNSSRNGNEPCDVYKLDWSDFNNQTKLNHEKWMKSSVSKFKERFKRDYTESLENYYMNLMTDQEFIIPDHYLRFIRHYSELANKEWDENKPFDTSVRDRLLKIAEECITNAFYLLADCIYGCQNYNHTFVRIWKSCALTNFWMPQTGRGLVSYRAKIDEFEDIIKNGNNSTWYTKNEIDEMQKWVNSFKNQYKKIDEMYERITEKEYQILKREEKLKKII